MFHWSRGSTLCFSLWGTRVQSPVGYFCETRIPLLALSRRNWWPWRDWSLWPRLRRASSWTITRPSCRQCDNPTWSHRALLSRFHAVCRSSLRLHNRHGRLLGGGEPYWEPATSLRSYHVSLVQWVNPLLPVMRDLGSIPRRGTYRYVYETRILLLALSRYSTHFTWGTLFIGTHRLLWMSQVPFRHGEIKV